MKSKYKPYSSYRDSGVRWLGDIPESWKVIKTAYLFSSAMGQTILKEDLIDDGRYPVYSATAEDKFFGYVNYATVKLKKNDIVIPARGNSIGFVKLVKDNATTTQTTIYCKPLTQRTNPKYVYYYMLGLKPHLFYFVQTAIPQITVSEVLSNPLLLPPFQDQQTIANYLDSATAKIDTLIEKQTRLIALLKEKRQAVISTAVTRGLDNTVAMKDSEVEWLGEIPAHWEVKKLKFIAYAKPSNVDKKSKDGEKDVLLCNYTDVYYNDFITNDIEFMKATATNEQIKKFTLNVDDVIITKDSEGPEDIAIATCVKEVQDNLVCGYHLTHIKPTKCNGRYLFRAFNSDGIHDQFKVAANGITRYGIGVYGIDNSFFPAPPMKEQEEIANYIDDKTSKIDTLISKASKAIELLKERRTALISAVVTGKIDVREINMESA